jgi:hypothetical protein
MSEAKSPRRSRMAHPERDQATLGSEWQCILNMLEECEPDLSKWALWVVYGDNAEHYDALPFEVPLSLKKTLLCAQNVTFYGSGRGLGSEPCGLELFGALKDKGFDPAMNASEIDIVNDFFRNIDSWVSPFLCAC